MVQEPAQVGIVGTAENVERVVESLELQASVETLLIVVDDSSEAIEQIDLSRDPTCSASSGSTTHATGAATRSF